MLEPFRRAGAVVAACALLALGLAAAVVTQSQPARAAASMGEFTFAADSGRFSDAEPFGPTLSTPAACPDYEVKDENGNVVESIPIDYTLSLAVAEPDGGSATLMASITSASPYDAAKPASLAAADNPDLGLRNPSEVFTSDGTYELRLVCLDDFGGAHPDGNYWTQKITVTGDTWVAGEGAKATGTTLTAAPSVIEPHQETTFTATLSPADAAGSVTFLEGATTLGQATVTGGKAELKTSDLTEGQHAVTARFTPADTTKWGASESEPFRVTVQSPRYEMHDATGRLLPYNPELERGQTVEVVIRGCTPGATYTMALFHDDTTFPDATAATDGTVTWPALTVPDDAVAGQTRWDYSPDCTGVGSVGAVDFTVPEPSESPSGSPSDSPTDGPPSDEPTDGPSDGPTDGSSGDTSGVSGGSTGGGDAGGGSTGGSTGGGSTSGGTSPAGGLASTGGEIALFSGIGAVVLVTAGVLAVRFGRREGLLRFGAPRP
ncbi:Ig-like domain-containing protein [Streptomyces sp. NPDC001083]|uniref:Ig-like domain-containing protein n=1 Tax=Streptomyces sp. NPDC001083 TaxID=3364545 RepID=UPI0036CFA98A